jgi:hypothetical protein
MEFAPKKKLPKDLGAKKEPEEMRKSVCVINSPFLQRSGRLREQMKSLNSDHRCPLVPVLRIAPLKTGTYEAKPDTFGCYSVRSDVNRHRAV